jgi:hypothetical protein
MKTIWLTIAQFLVFGAFILGVATASFIESKLTVPKKWAATAEDIGTERFYNGHDDLFPEGDDLPCYHTTYGLKGLVFLLKDGEYLFDDMADYLETKAAIKKSKKKFSLTVTKLQQGNQVVFLIHKLTVYEFAPNLRDN